MNSYLGESLKSDYNLKKTTSTVKNNLNNYNISNRNTNIDTGQKSNNINININNINKIIKYL